MQGILYKCVDLYPKHCIVEHYIIVDHLLEALCLLTGRAPVIKHIFQGGFKPLRAKVLIVHLSIYHRSAISCDLAYVSERWVNFFLAQIMRIFTYYLFTNNNSYGRRLSYLILQTRTGVISNNILLRIFNKAQNLPITVLCAMQKLHFPKERAGGKAILLYVLVCASLQEFGVTIENILIRKEGAMIL